MRLFLTDDPNHLGSFRVHHGEESPELGPAHYHEALLADGVIRIGDCHRERVSESARRLAEGDPVLVFVG